MKQIQLNELQTRLEEFGSKLSATQCEEFRQILFSIGALHNSVGDIYKYAEIALIPRDRPIVRGTSTFAYKQGECVCAGHPGKNVLCPYCGCTEPTFKPPAKQDLASIAMTLARNLELNLKKE